MRLLKKFLQKTNFDEKPLILKGWGLVIIWVYFLFWLASVIFLYAYWQDLSAWIKYPLAFIEAIFAPDISIFNDLFWRNKKS